MGLTELALFDLAFRVLREVIEIFIKDEEKKEQVNQQVAALEKTIKDSEVA